MHTNEFKTFISYYDPVSILTIVHSVNKHTLPPSAIAVLSVLEDGSPKTFKDMTEQVSIAPRTVRYALKRLKENGLVIEKFNFRDARQVLYMKKIQSESETHAEMAST